uniref:Uncharacterized protein n=1 Tax=Phytoplasma australiense TaxID=59748 RepID=Q0QLC8_PHYAS|nr:hypothetical protein [Candidatus Phytoplasma australiense]ABD04141.1 hypothetical protein [Candidatus Phytoplasma australiense]
MQQLFNFNIEEIINKIKLYATIIITFIKTTFNNIIAIKNVDFHIGNILNSSGIIINFILSLFYILIFITFLVLLGSIFNIIKTTIKIIFFPFKILFIGVFKFIQFLIGPKPKPDVSISNKNQDDEIKKQLFLLKLQNGKLKKQLEKKVGKTNVKK